MEGSRSDYNDGYRQHPMRYAPGRHIFTYATNTTVILQSGSGVFGTLHTFLATVTSPTSGSTPQGSLQFKDNGSNLGAVQTLNGGGQASISTSSLAVGAHTIAGDYSPTDGLHEASSGSTGITIQYGTSTSVVLQGNPVQYGATQILQATVSGTNGAPAPGAGWNVDFYVAGSYIGSSSTNASSIATFDIGNSRNVGTYNIGAVFSGGGNYLSSGGSSTNTMTINQATVSNTSFGSSVNPTEYGESWALVSTWVSSTGVPVVGSVDFYRSDLNTYYGSEVVFAGSAPLLVLGTYTSATHPTSTVWKAQFTGSMNFAATGFTGDHTHTHNKQGTSTVITSVTPSTSVGSPASSTDIIVVQGTVTYDFVPVAGETVNIYSTDSSSTVRLVGGTTTDAFGNFVFGIEIGASGAFPEPGPEPYIITASHEVAALSAFSEDAVSPFWVSP